MHTLNKIIEGQNLLKNEKDKGLKKELAKKVYTVGQSSLEFDKNNNLYLYSYIYNSKRLLFVCKHFHKYILLSNC